MEKIKKNQKIVGYREKIYFGNKEIKSPTFKTEKEAKSWKAKKQNEKEMFHQTGYNPGNPILFEQYAETWLENIRLNKSIRTVENYEFALKKKILPFFGKKKLLSIQRRDGAKFVAHLGELGHNPKGLKNIFNIVKSIFNEAEKDYLVLNNPIKHVATPKVPPKTPKYWSEDTINRFFLFHKNDPVLFPLIQVAIYTGLRMGELAALRWGQVLWQQNSLQINATRDKKGRREMTKSGKIRHVPMNGSIRKTLQYLFENSINEERYVFCEINGEKLKVHHLYRRFRKAQIDAGVSDEELINFHKLRDTFASHFMMKGGDIYELQKILGHNSIDITQVYAHLSPNHLARATEFLSFGEVNKFSRPILGHQTKEGVQRGNLATPSF
jgi:site-specific recombinase XerC